MTTAYPLSWPEGMPRSKHHRRRNFIPGRRLLRQQALFSKADGPLTRSAERVLRENIRRAQGVANG